MISTDPVKSSDRPEEPVGGYGPWTYPMDVIAKPAVHADPGANGGT
jgi:hypothetical protein